MDLQRSPLLARARLYRLFSRETDILTKDDWPDLPYEINEGLKGLQSVKDDPRRTHWLLQTLEKDGSAIPLTYKLAIKNLSEHKAAGPALWAVHMMRKRNMTIGYRDFWQVLSALQVKGMWFQARRLLDEMLSDGQKPTLPIFSMVINAHKKEAKWKSALEVWDMLLASGLKPTERMYAEMVKVLIKGRQFELVEDMLEEVCREVTQLSPATIRGFLKAHAETGNIDSAMNLLSMLKDINEDNSSAYILAIRAASKARQVDQAMTLMQDMRSADKGFVTSFIYQYPLLACAMEGDIPRLNQVWEAMLEDGVEPDNRVFYTKVLALTKVGDMEAACKAIQESKAHLGEIDVRMYHPLMQSHLEHGRFQEALDLFYQIKAEGMPLRPATLVLAANCLDELGRVEDAVDLVRQSLIDFSHLPVHTRNDLAELCERGGDEELADFIRRSGWKKETERGLSRV